MADNATVEGETHGDDAGTRSLEVYEWGGAVVAGLGFFLTPAVTGLPALYCALKVRTEKPLAAVGIGVVVLVTALFWAGFLFGEELIALTTPGGGATGPTVFFVYFAIVVVPVLVFLAVLGWRR